MKTFTIKLDTIIFILKILLMLSFMGLLGTALFANTNQRNCLTTAHQYQQYQSTITAQHQPLSQQHFSARLWKINILF